MSHFYETLKQLREIPVLHTMASECLIPGNGGNGSSSGERTIGLNVDALDFSVALDLLGTLESWQGLVIDEQELPSKSGRKGSADYRVKAVCEFLQVHYEWLMKHESATDFIREVGEIHWRGLQATNQIPVKNTRVDCPSDMDDGTLCGGRIILKSTDTNEQITCRQCSRVWTTEWLIKVAATSSKTHMWVDIEVLVQHFHLTTSEVKKIARKHLVTTQGRKPELYSFKHFNDAMEKINDRILHLTKSKLG